MKTFKHLLVLLAVSLFMPSMPFGIQANVLSAQTTCGTGITGCARTTLSAAMAGGSANNTMRVASATGIVASGTSVASASMTGGQSYCLVDRELVQVRSINGTALTVARASKGVAAGHISGAQVICGGTASWNPSTGNATGVFLGTGTFQPSGSCTRSNQQFLPLFAVDSTYGNGFTYDCLGGKWVQGTLPDLPDATPLVAACNIPISAGSTTLGYTWLGVGSSGVNGQEWETSIMLQKTAFLRGVNFLSGASSGVDKYYAIVRDSAGNVVANSALAGVTLGTASAFQPAPFTASQFLVGTPGGVRYIVSVQGNTTSSNQIAVVAPSTAVDILGAIQSGTFGTITPIPGVAGNGTYVLPSGFQGNQAPIVCLFY